MSKNKIIAIFVIFVFGALYIPTVRAIDINMTNLSGLIDRAKITKGKPTEAWNSPLGDSNINRKQANKEAQERNAELKKQLDEIMKDADKKKGDVDDRVKKENKQVNDKASEDIKEAKKETDISKREEKIAKINEQKAKDLEVIKENAEKEKQNIDDEAEAKRVEAYNSNKSGNEGNNNTTKNKPEGSADGTLIEDTNINRCRLIKLIKPGVNKVEEMQRVATILQAYYSSELYAQAMQTLYELDKEDPHPFTNQSSKKAILDKNVRDVLLDTAQRLAIVASLEARTAVVDNISKLIKLSPEVYQTKDCENETSSSGKDDNVGK